MKNLKKIALKHNLKSLCITLLVIIAFWAQFRFSDVFTQIYKYKALYLLPIGIGTILVYVNIKWTRSHFREEIPEVYFDHYLTPITKGNNNLNTPIFSALPRSKDGAKLRKKERCKFQGSLDNPKITYQISRVQLSLSKRKGTKRKDYYVIDGDIIYARTTLNFCDEPIMFVNEELVDFSTRKFLQKNALKFRVTDEVKGFLLYNGVSENQVLGIRKLIKENPILFMQPKNTVCYFSKNTILYLTSEYYQDYQHIPMFIFKSSFDSYTYNINSEIDRFNLFVDEIESFSIS